MKSFVSRQQVREINKKLFAYDLVYEGDEDGTLETLVSTIIQRYNPEDELAGVPTILEVKPDDITPEIIDTISLLDTKSVILQFNNDVLANPNKVAIIEQIKKIGYKVIIELNKDDKVFTLARILADIIKLDITNIPTEIANNSVSFNCKKLAYNVDTPEGFALAQAANMEYYEGSYIASSTEVEIESTQHSEINFTEIIKLVNNEDSSIKDVSTAIQRDSLMAAQVIRLANSAYYYSSKRIESVEDAVTRIGLGSLKRWIFLLKFSRNYNSPEELLQTSYHRATFCEQIVKESKLKSIKPGDAYLIGLFSILDVLTGKLMDTELASMRLNEVIEEALIYKDGIGGDLLNLIRAYENSDKTRVEKYIKKFKLTEDKLFEVYYRSIDEVSKVWKDLTKLGGTY